MFFVMLRLKLVKGAMKHLNKEGFAEIHTKDAKAYGHLLECQNRLHEHRDADRSEKGR